MNLSTRQLSTSLGHQITVFAGDHIGKQIQQHGLYEKEKLLLLNALIGKLDNPVVLDIGANIGNHTLAFASCAARVLAFEPIPDIFAVLDGNIQQNSLTNVQAFNLALSDQDCTTSIYLGPDRNLGMSSLTPREGSTESVEVSCRNGDAFLAALDLPKIDFMKIDVEGHEQLVIKGLMHTIRQYHPVITMEWNDARAIEGFANSPELEYLHEAYCFFGLGTNHDRTVWEDQPLALLKRKFNRWFKPRKAVIHTFRPHWNYDNILLIPRGQLSLLDLPGA